MKHVKRILCGLLAALLALPLIGCGGAQHGGDGGAPELPGLTWESTEPLQYADQFAIYRYAGGYSLIDMVNSDRILVVPEGGAVPEGLDADIVAVQQPLDNIYLTATSAMALFEAIGGVGAISYVGTKDWYTDGAAQALARGDFAYAGKYSAPDYELLLGGGCRLAIESTMILHTPEVKEKLIELGIPTVVERSSYEGHPLGRTEWVKVYGELLGRREEAEAVFAAQAEMVRALEGLPSTGKTVAFFYVSSGGSAVTYKTEGYVPAMIRLAGGEYVFTDLGLDDDSKLSTINLSMETFYQTAREADVVIYNCSIVEQLTCLQDLLDLSPVLEDFKAVRESSVWCTTASMFQQTDKMGEIIREINAVLSGQAGELTYLFRLQ